MIACCSWIKDNGQEHPHPPPSLPPSPCFEWGIELWICNEYWSESEHGNNIKELGQRKKSTQTQLAKFQTQTLGHSVFQLRLRRISVSKRSVRWQLLGQCMTGRQSWSHSIFHCVSTQEHNALSALTHLFYRDRVCEKVIASWYIL